MPLILRAFLFWQKTCTQVRGHRETRQGLIAEPAPRPGRIVKESTRWNRGTLQHTPALDARRDTMIHKVTSPFTGKIVRWTKKDGDQVSEYDPEPIYFVRPDIPASNEYGISSPATGRLTILRMGRPGTWV